MENHNNSGHFKEWLRSTGKRIELILSGGIAIVVCLYEHWKGRNINWTTSCWIAVFGGFWACYLSWRDKAVELRKSQQDHAADMVKWKLEADNKEREKAEKKAIVDSIGLFKSGLTDRIRHIQSIGADEYANKYPANGNHLFDNYTDGLLKAIATFLETSYSKRESALFLDLCGLERSIRPAIGAPKFDRWQSVIDHLKHFESQLNLIVRETLTQ